MTDHAKTPYEIIMDRVTIAQEAAIADAIRVYEDAKANPEIPHREALRTYWKARCRAADAADAGFLEAIATLDFEMEAQ